LDFGVHDPTRAFAPNLSVMMTLSAIATTAAVEVPAFDQENGATQSSAANASSADAPKTGKKKRRRRRLSKKKLAEKEARRVERLAAEAAAADAAYVPEDAVAAEDEVLDVDIVDTEAAEAAAELAGLVADAADMGKLPEGRRNRCAAAGDESPAVIDATVEKTPTAAAEAAVSDRMDISLVSVDSSLVTEAPIAQRLGAEEKGEACNACAVM
jgi:hypothetical protein